MERTRVKLGVFVDLDPTPGTFHSADSAQHVVRNILQQAMPHYSPSVSIDSYDTSREHGERQEPNAKIMFYRVKEERARENASHRLSKWQMQLVGPFNSEMTDGVEYDLVRHYQSSGDWEVHLIDIHMPSEYDFVED